MLNEKKAASSDVVNVVAFRRWFANSSSLIISSTVLGSPIPGFKKKARLQRQGFGKTELTLALSPLRTGFVMTLGVRFSFQSSKSCYLR